MFVYVCFDYVCVGIGFVDWQGFMYERFWSVRLFMTEFESVGVTLCGWQDVKIQSLTNWNGPANDILNITYQCINNIQRWGALEPAGLMNKIRAYSVA